MGGEMNTPGALTTNLSDFSSVLWWRVSWDGVSDMLQYPKIFSNSPILDTELLDHHRVEGHRVETFPADGDVIGSGIHLGASRDAGGFSFALFLLGL